MKKFSIVNLFIVILLFFLGINTSAKAETFYYPDETNTKFQITVPANWQVEKLPEGRYSFTSPTEEIKAYLFTVRGNEDYALNVLVSETEVILKYDVNNPSILGGGFRPMQLNGMTATQLKSKGTRTDDKEPIVLDFIIFSPDRQLWALLHAIYDLNTPEQEQKDFVKLVRSIKPPA